MIYIEKVFFSTVPVNILQFTFQVLAKNLKIMIGQMETLVIRVYVHY